MFDQNETYEKRVFWCSLAVVSIFHLGALLLLLTAGQVQSKDIFKPLAVVDFAYYDPDAGLGGASDNDEVMEPMPLPAQAEVLAIEGIMAPEPEPEPELEETPNVIESTSEAAAPLPAQPPPEKVKPKPEEKPKPKAKPRPAQAYRPGAADASGEARTAGGHEGQGAGGAGAGQGQGNPDLLRAYTAQIQRQLNHHKKYPSEARSQRLAGVSTVNFSVNSQGQVTSSRLVKSSGYQVLDNEALALLKRVSPLPAMPAELNLASLNMTVPIVFSVR